MVRRFLSVFSMVALISACGSDSPGPTITLSGPVNDLGNGEGLEGVEVCILNTSTCTTTDADGVYSIDGVPAESNISLSVTMPEYLGGVIPVMTGSEAQTVPVVSMGSELLSELQIGILDVPAVADAGQIAFSISNGIFGDRINVPGIQVALEPAAGDGPFYTTSSGLPDTELTETSSNGGGVFVNLPAGTYTLRYLNLPEGCTPMLGWGPVEAPSFEIAPGRTTYVRIECAEGA
ncbi:MAG: carboxypeptidase regulatory-like domain-containing protein [Myxococcota bacterium]|nr:carboxypeptidase regulatory-like domain-containing protein [Myxococcota bacterium]